MSHREEWIRNVIYLLICKTKNLLSSQSTPGKGLEAGCLEWGELCVCVYVYIYHVCIIPILIVLI